MKTAFTSCVHHGRRGVRRSRRFGQGKTYKVGVIPKFMAEDYFIACERGFRQAEKELGNIKVDWIGDTMSPSVPL